MIEKFEKFNQKISQFLELIGLAGMIFIVFITTIDVIGAKLFLHPVFGALDSVMISQVVAISFAAAITLIIGRHVEVEFLVMLFPKRLQMVIDLFAKILCLILFLIIFWQMFKFANHLRIKNEVTPTARIPLYPFAYSISIGCIPVCLIYISLAINSFLRLVKNDT